jgi:hypothetical protein
MEDVIRHTTEEVGVPVAAMPQPQPRNATSPPQAAHCTRQPPQPPLHISRHHCPHHAGKVPLEVGGEPTQSHKQQQKVVPYPWWCRGSCGALVSVHLLDHHHSTPRTPHAHPSGTAPTPSIAPVRSDTHQPCMTSTSARQDEGRQEQNWGRGGHFLHPVKVSSLGRTHIALVS